MSRMHLGRKKDQMIRKAKTEDLSTANGQNNNNNSNLGKPGVLGRLRSMASTRSVPDKGNNSKSSKSSFNLFRNKNKKPSPEEIKKQQLLDEAIAFKNKIEASYRKGMRGLMINMNQRKFDAKVAELQALGVDQSEIPVITLEENNDAVTGNPYKGRPLFGSAKAAILRIIESYAENKQSFYKWVDDLESGKIKDDTWKQWIKNTKNIISPGAASAANTLTDRDVADAMKNKQKISRKKTYKRHLNDQIRKKLFTEFLTRINQVKSIPEPIRQAAIQSQQIESYLFLAEFDDFDNKDTVAKLDTYIRFISPGSPTQINLSDQLFEAIDEGILEEIDGLNNNNPLAQELNENNFLQNELTLRRNLETSGFLQNSDEKLSNVSLLDNAVLINQLENRDQNDPLRKALEKLRIQRQRLDTVENIRQTVRNRNLKKSGQKGYGIANKQNNRTKVTKDNQIASTGTMLTNTALANANQQNNNNALLSSSTPTSMTTVDTPANTNRENNNNALLSSSTPTTMVTVDTPANTNQSNNDNNAINNAHVRVNSVNAILGDLGNVLEPTQDELDIMGGALNQLTRNRANNTTTNQANNIAYNNGNFSYTGNDDTGI